ncbi:MAG: glycoside hydrolase family 78 protein [Planctomycetaceae bacterium]|nr:glycoside hydrolase family 78 protein [Planctomycetaceae bacterium]
MRTLVSAVFVFLAASWTCAGESPATADYLRCEYRVNPLGIEVTEPRLSWEMNDSRRGAKQTAYQILVASTPEKLAADEGDLWDTGRVESNQSTQIVYAGKPLGSRMQCQWKVRIWDADGATSVYSKPALWSMGLLKGEEFQAKWIGVEGPMVDPQTKAGRPITLDDCVWVWSHEPGADALRNAPAGKRYFRKAISIPAGRPIFKATLAVGGDDGWSVFVNGTQVGAGGGYKQPMPYDVTPQLQNGDNCVAIAVSNHVASPAGLTGKLVVEFEQGEPLVVPIDASWKVSATESPNWTTTAFDDSSWATAVRIAKMGDAPWGKIKLPKRLSDYTCALMRKEFTISGEVRRATLYGSALGIYRMYINGRPIGQDYFTPDWTDYKKRVYYNTYDVTELVRDGENAIGGVLGAGWYAGAIGWLLERNHFGDHPRLMAQLEIELADGTVETIVTDDSWKTAYGPYRQAEFLAGETYDARREIHGWTSPGLDDSAWKPVAATAEIPCKLQAFPGVNVHETGELRPVKVTEPAPQVYVFDMGQNFAGFARLKARGPVNTKVRLRFAEMLNPDGTIYTTNLRGARATDTYVLRGDGEEVWQPRFTFHGFRYVEVTGYPGRPGEDAITGIAINSDVPLTGSFECSSPMVNRLYKNIVWTQRANYISVPTDCPQRDERLGWMGDASTFVRAATYNADVGAFFTKWLVDVEDAQRADGQFSDVSPRVVAPDGGVAAWADAGTICPWTIYQVYNDKRLLAKHYDAMTRWVEFCRKSSKGLLRPAAGYGDWLSIKADTPLDVLATAYFAYSTRLTADAARVLGKKADAEKYDELFRQIKAAFNKAYVADDGRIKGNTQTCYVLALAFDLLPAEKRPAAARYLVDDIKSRGTHLSTGFVGTSVLMPTLSATGNTPLAYKLLLNDTFPSWGFSIKHGATSIWERWDGWTPEKGFQDPGMNSFAHYSFGAVARWLFQTVAGIDTTEPGFQRLKIRPEPAPGLTWVKASYHSIHGRIAVEWKTEGDKLKLAVSIPANTTAVVYLPGSDPTGMTESGKPITEAKGVKFLRKEGGESLFEVSAGSYELVTPWAG